LSYREPHLQKKADECSAIYNEWRELFDNLETRRSKEAKEIRKRWGKCVKEFGDMVSQEVKTNPRYNGLEMNKNT